MHCDVIEESSTFPAPRARLHEAMMWLAESLCCRSVAVDELAWSVEQLDRTQCRAIWEHAKAGRVNYYELKDEPGVIRVEPRKGLAEWWSKQLTSRKADGDEADCSAKSGQPGRPTKTLALARFANRCRKRKPQMTWNDIWVEWKSKHPKDEWVKNRETVRHAWRRHFGDKSK
jgi:hypothetical protein